MEKLLRVLNIEDSQDDSYLLRRFLTKAGYELQFRQVQGRAEFAAAMEEGTWDIILADYRVPGFEAPAALEALKELSNDIPLVVVSGAIGEEAAAEVMRLGAADFVAKDSLARLVPAIERELADHQIRKERKLEQFKRVQSEAKLRAILDHSPAAIYMKDREGRYTLVNRIFAEMLGVTESQLIGKTDHEIFEPEIAAALHHTDMMVLRDSAPHQEQHPVKMGTSEFVTVKFPVFDAFGVVQGIGGIATPSHYVFKAAGERKVG